MSTGIDGGAPSYKRKLIEVALPLEDINREAAREKSIRYGHPSTLHLWWSRKPLGAARAVIFGQLVDDPSANLERFPTIESQQAERERLFAIMRDLVAWDNSTDESVLNAARKEIWDSCDGCPPPISDPFAGGGSIPLEAQRLGLEVYASDLNPVAVLINKAMIQFPPKWSGAAPAHPTAHRRMQWRGAEGLAEDVRCYGKKVRDEAQRRIGHLYPQVKLDDGTYANAVAWIWARTVTCPNPACGGTMPLASSFWLGKKPGKQRYIHPLADGKRVRFEIRGPQGTPRNGTVSRTGAECLLCGAAVSLSYIRAEGRAGRMGTQLMAIAAEGKRTRYYLPPNELHEQAADVPRPDGAPDADLPDQALGFRIQSYGMRTWSDLFTARQLTLLTTISDLAIEIYPRILADAMAAAIPEPELYAAAVRLYLALSIDRIADNSSSLCIWMYMPSKEGTAHTFGRAALPMIWNFGEGNPFKAGPCDYGTSCEWVARVLDELPGSGIREAVASVKNAAERLSVQTLTATDPPYYDNIPYADLSDFFYVWLRRSLLPIFSDLLGTVLSPKSEELVADPIRQGGPSKAKSFFEAGFLKVFSRIRESALAEYPISVFYAFKQSETELDGRSSTGWETLLGALLGSGWQITATWPMRTERIGRVRQIGSNALASSIVLACRPRPNNAPITDRRGFLAKLRAELPWRLRELQQGNVAPVDLAQAAIGPGMAVYSRHQRVTEPDGSPMSVRLALQLINQVLDEVLAEQEGDFDTDSRWCVRWFEQVEWAAEEYGRAETLATALNTSMSGLERAGVVRARTGRVQLVRPAEMPSSYDPVKDVRPTMWEAALHLSRCLERDGAEAAGRLMRRLQSVMDLNGVKELAYLLYNVCDRKRRQESALMFNNLVTSWPEIADAALRSRESESYQAAMDFSDE